MSDIYKDLRFKVADDKNAFVKYYYPLDKDSDIDVIYKGDNVELKYYNDTPIFGEVVKVRDLGFILKMVDGNRLAIPYSKILDIRIIQRKNEELSKDNFLQFAWDNLNKRVIIETTYGLGYKGVLENYNLRTKELDIITYSGRVNIPQNCITKYYVEEEVSKMSPDKFKELLDELDGNSLQTLKEKNAKYSKNGDSLHNFRTGAEIMGCTTAQACWRYMAKHLADLRNKIDADDFSDREDFLEKCQDTINYIRFLWCIGNDKK